MTYIRYYAAWKDDPDPSTPATARFMQQVEDTFVFQDGRITTLESGGGGGGGGAVSSVAGRTGAVVLTKTDVGLVNVDNTSDVNKPVSTAQSAANALLVPKSLYATKGDLVVANASGVVTTLPIPTAGGTDGQVLTKDATQSLGIKWAAPTGGSGIPNSLLTGKGTIPVGTTTTGTGQTQAAPPFDDTVLTGDSAQATGLSWKSPSYSIVSANGTDRATRTRLNFSSAFTVTDDSTGGGRTNIDVTGGGTSVPPGYTALFRGGGTGFDQNTWRVPANPGESFYYIDISTNTDGNGAIISVSNPTPANSNKPVIINICLQQDSTGGKKWDISPSTVAWESGLPPATDIFQPSRFDISAGVITMIKLTWMGNNIGYLGKLVGSIPPYYYPLNQNPTSWTMTQSVTPWNGINNQSIVTPVYFMRYVLPIVREYFYNALCHFCSAAMRTRLSANNYVVEIGSRFNCDGLRGGRDNRGFIEAAGGYSATATEGGYISGGSISTQAGAIALISHEMAHGISANYYGGNNPAPGAGIGNGSEPNLMSQHSTLVTLQNDCINNGNGSVFSDEWFAEMFRGMRVGDNGILSPVSGSPLSAVGPNTNAGPGGTGGTPQQRADRFSAYINTLGLV